MIGLLYQHHIMLNESCEMHLNLDDGLLPMPEHATVHSYSQ